ncbi:hypothetical protein ACFL2T_04660, partial [Elusimicrobiota bacterium]
PGSPRPPAPPPAGMVRREESPLMEYMRQRMEIMEREILKERERALGSEALLKQQEDLRNQVETQLKKISQQVRQEKTVRDLEDNKQQSVARVEALEKRLDEMHNTWAELLKDSVKRQEATHKSLAPEIRAFTEGMAALRDELRVMKEGFSRLQEDVHPFSSLASEVEGLRAAIPAASRRREAEDKALRDELSGMVDRIGEGLIERLDAIDRRVAQEVHEHQDRLATMSQERHALQESVEEQHHRIRQEHLKERVALESQFNDQVAGLKTSLESLAERQTGAADSIARLQDLSKKVHAILTQPAKAKDQMVQELEIEKRDLMAALKQRTEQLRAYTLERREVERSMGESLMDLNRQLELERSKHQQEKDHIASLENALQALRAQMELKEEEGKQKDQRFSALAEERDSLVRALTEEAEKVRKQIEDRTASDKLWEGRILDFQKAVADEREQRLAAEGAVSELRAQTQTLSDHIARVLRDKETTEKKFSEWDKERETLEETMHKKDEMIGMLSSTFQNLLKKPE